MMKINIIIYNAICMMNFITVHTKKVSVSRKSETSDIGNNEEGQDVDHPLGSASDQPRLNNNCWLSLNTKKHFQIMDELDSRYRSERIEYQNKTGGDFDGNMLQALLKTRGIAIRAVHKAGGDPNLIPAGLNLGGYCMIRMMESVLFFHRVKLRNDTRFRVNFLHNDLVNMVLIARLSLNDLHLLGAYERSPTDKDPSVLFYAPTYGQVEFLMKNVEYKMEGRLRLLGDRLTIELVISEIIVEDILMTYLNNAIPDPPIRLQKQNIEDFIARLKSDLDMWLKDYFNDYLMYFGLIDPPNAQIQQAEKQKALALNEYADYAINVIKGKIRQLGAASAKIPHFTIFSARSMQLKLTDGVIRGLDSLYRRSVATGVKKDDIRNVDLVVGFSNLKVVYKYEAILPTGMPPLSGLLILTADELTARMGLSLVKEPDAVDLDFDFLQQMKPESLTVEGPANRMISNFKHLLEHHIIAIMSNTLIYNVKMLRTLTKCEPLILGQDNKNTNKQYAGVVKNTSDENYNDISQKEYKQQSDNSIQEKAVIDHLSDEEENQENPSGDDQDTNREEPILDNVSHSNDESNIFTPPQFENELPDDQIPSDYFVTTNNSEELPWSESDVKYGDIVSLDIG